MRSFSTKLTETYQGVDDSGSVYYNLIIDIANLPANVTPDWKSFEIMKRKDNLYKWLFIIGHNSDRKPGMGSLIFLHIWRSQILGTAGCTAVSEENMLKLVDTLDVNRNPMILQVPIDEYRILQNYYNLPDII